MVKVLDCGARGPGFDPRPRQQNFQKYSEEIDVIKDHRPIGNGPFIWRRSIGPLPSCFLTLLFISWIFSCDFFLHVNVLHGGYIVHSNKVRFFAVMSLFSYGFWVQFCAQQWQHWMSRVFKVFPKPANSRLLPLLCYRKSLKTKHAPSRMEMRFISIAEMEKARRKCPHFLKP